MSVLDKLLSIVRTMLSRSRHLFETVLRDEIPFPPVEIRRLERRRWILYFAQRGGIGAEIGVFRGHFSAVLAEILKPQLLYLVDPWTKLGETFGWGEETLYTGYGRLTTKYAYEDTQRRVAKFKNSDIRLIETTACEFFAGLNEKLDWVYLDASHNYEPTLNELRLIDKALKADGVIIGDDWQPSRDHIHHGVFRAVNEFIRTNSYELVAAGPAGQWCIRRAEAKTSKQEIRLSQQQYVLHAAIDKMRKCQADDQYFDIGGVVVLSHEADVNCTLWISDSTVSRQVQWGIRSPIMAITYPEGSNSERSRFSIEHFAMRPGQAVDLFLMDSTGKRVDLSEIQINPPKAKLAINAIESVTRPLA